MKKAIYMRRWIVWGLAVAFYFYEYFIRVAPAVMVEDLFRSFQIGAGTVGIISAAYLYAYAPMQLPVGVLMDRFGARKLLTFATLICGFAALLFGIAPTVWITILSRVLMGGGSAFAFIGMIYISSHWFHGKILALLVGLGNSIGMLGAVFGEGPLSELIHIFRWRPIMVGLGLMGFALAATIFLIIRNDPAGATKKEPLHRPPSLLQSIKCVSRNRQTWVNGIVAMTLYTPIVAFGALWAIPFLQQTQGYSNEVASFASSMIFLGMIVMGPIIGHFSDKTCNRKGWLFASTLLGILFFSLIVYTPIIRPLWIFSLMFLLGAALSAQLLNYALAIELNTPATKGAALAITNCLVFVAGSLAQTVIGLLMDGKWSGQIEGGVRIYSLENYQLALLLLPTMLLIAFFSTFFLTEKKKPWCSYPPSQITR